MKELTGNNLSKDKVYRFIDSPINLKYVGMFIGFHSFVRVDSPSEVYAEMLKSEIHLIEEVK